MDIASYARELLVADPWPAPVQMCASLDPVVKPGAGERRVLMSPPRSGKTTAAKALAMAALCRHQSVLYVAYAQALADDVAHRLREWHGRDPELRALGRGAATLSYSADLIVVDDPIKDMVEARSETLVGQLRDWFACCLLPKLAPGGSIVVIGSRWPGCDFLGWVSGLPGWTTQKWRALDEYGRPTMPEQFSRERLQEFEDTMGEAWFRGLYQQEVG